MHIESPFSAVQHEPAAVQHEPAAVQHEPAAAPREPEAPIPVYADPVPTSTGDRITKRPNAVSQTAPTAATMFNHGSMWEHLRTPDKNRDQQFLRFTDHPGLYEQGVHIMSAVNMAHLEDAVLPLNSVEEKFLKAAMDQPWFLTHATKSESLEKATRKDGSLVIKSRDVLIKQKLIPETHGNTTKRDRAVMHGTDFVYNAIEVGPELQKPSSRFGEKIIRFPLDGALERRAVSIPDDQFVIGSDNNSKTISKKMTEDIGLDWKSVKLLSGRRMTSENYTAEIFSGRDIKRGTILQAIKDFRTARQTNLLCQTSPLSINRVINGIGRPQVLIPKAVILRKDDYTTHEFKVPPRRKKLQLSAPTVMPSAANATPIDDSNILISNPLQFGSYSPFGHNVSPLNSPFLDLDH